MTNEKKQPKPLGVGFQKRQIVESPQIAVNPDDIAAMQRRYETRIARQAEALTRMADLLDDRTNDALEHMKRANEMAAQVVEGELGVIPTSVPDGDVDELLRMAVEDWDGYNEEDTPRDILATYIRYAQDVARESRKIGDLIRPIAQTLGVNLRDKSNCARSGVDIVSDVLRMLQRDLAQARADAQRNADAANAAIKAQYAGDIGDDAEVPPWQRGDQQSFTAPVEIDRVAGIPMPVQVQPDADREILSWSGSEDLGPDNEDRPGRSF